MFWTRTNRAKRLEAKGDKLAARGLHAQALKHYRKALAFDPERTALFDKLVAEQDAMPGDWQLEDFVESVSCVMKKQEQDHPPIRQVHAKLSPEWTDASELLLKIMTSTDSDQTAQWVEDLVAMGEVGTRAAVQLLVDMKTASEDDPSKQDAGSKMQEIDE